MRSNRKNSVLRRVLLIIGLALVGISIASHVASRAQEPSDELQVNLSPPTQNVFTGASAVDERKAVSVAIRRTAPAQSLYDRRRRYVEDRVERRLDRRQEYLDRQSGGDDEDEDSGGDDSDMGDDDSSADDEDLDAEVERVERRRENWRQRVDRNW